MRGLLLIGAAVCFVVAIFGPGLAVVAIVGALTLMERALR
jgi:hypothetical protein